MKDAATELVVVRHGETAWNSSGRMQGQVETELSDLGIRQADAVAEALAEDTFQHLVSSDLARAVQTAETIGRRLGLGVSTDSRLREQHLGIMQGLSMAEFREKHPHEHRRFSSRDPRYALPGGESIREFRERAITCANELARSHPGGSIVIVTHGGVLDSFFRHTVQMDAAAPRRWSLFNASLNAFSVLDGQWRLVLWGETRHLHQLGAKDECL